MILAPLLIAACWLPLIAAARRAGAERTYRVGMTLAVCTGWWNLIDPRSSPLTALTVSAVFAVALDRILWVTVDPAEIEQDVEAPDAAV